MNKIYVKGNYIIADKNGNVGEYPTSRSVYTTDETSIFVLEQIDKGTLIIQKTDVATWFDETGLIPFTEDTLIDFLQNNTANFSKVGASTFESLTDVPTYLGNALKGLRINAGEDAIESYVATDLNQWLMTGVAFVDPINGDNLTGTVGDGNLPFKTIAFGLLASNTVVLLAGNYTENFFVQLDNQHIHAMAGVNFIAGGVNVFGTGVNNFSFTGYATFVGSSRTLQVTNTNAIINFECKSMDNSVVLWTSGNAFAPKINYKCDWIRCSGFNGGAYCVRLVGNSEIQMDIKYYFHAQHANYHVRNGTTGKLIVNCPDSRIIDNYTSNYGNSFKKVFWADSANGAYIEINGNMQNDATVYVSSINCISLENWVNSSTLIINGDLIAEFQIPIYSGYRSAYGDIQINGNIKTGRNAMLDALSGWGGAVGQQWVFNGSIISAQFHTLVGGGKSYYFKDCAFNINEDGVLNPNAGSIFNAMASLQPTELFLFNCSMQTNDPLMFTFRNMTPQFTIGTVKSQSNVAVGAGVADIWEGVTVIPTLKTPKIY